VIPSASALTLGCEIIMVSFFLSILGLQVRRIDSRAQHEVLWPRSSELV